MTEKEEAKPPPSVTVEQTPRGSLMPIDFVDTDDPSFLETEAAVNRWEQGTFKRYELWKIERTKLNVHVFICSVAQLLLISLLFIEAYNDMDLKKVIKENLEIKLLAAKAICAMILHCSMNGRISQGNDMMKYALNHHMKFLNYSIAFKLGLMRTLTSLAVETISLILIFTQSNV